MFGLGVHSWRSLERHEPTFIGSRTSNNRRCRNSVHGWDISYEEMAVAKPISNDFDGIRAASNIHECHGCREACRSQRDAVWNRTACAAARDEAHNNCFIDGWDVVAWHDELCWAQLLMQNETLWRRLD
jgi:hypothetical protein